MGSSMSKSAQDVARRYPARGAGAIAQSATRPPPAASSASGARVSASAPRASPEHAASAVKNKAIADDGHDPDMSPSSFSARLHELGIVRPAPGLTLRPSVTTSFPGGGVSGTGRMRGAGGGAEVAALEARRRMEESGGGGRMDVARVARVVRLRDGGMEDGDVERELGLGRGALRKMLGNVGVVQWVRPGVESKS